MPHASPHVVDVTVETFASAVVERSKQVPVLLDFWAEWCGPCKALGPVLEKLAVEYDGAFVLAKVDTDAQPELAGAFQIQSIPTVVLVVDGAPADGFQGALPEAQLRQFLAPHLGPAADPLAPIWEVAEAGDSERALGMVEAALAERPDDADAQLLRATLWLRLGREAEAAAALDALPVAQQESAEGRALAAQLALAAEETPELSELRAAAREDDLASQVALGLGLAAAKRYEEALEVLLAAVRRDRDFDEQAARKAMVDVFDALGPDSELASDYRRRLQVALYV